MQCRWSVKPRHTAHTAAFEPYQTESPEARLTFDLLDRDVKFAYNRGFSATADRIVFLC